MALQQLNVWPPQTLRELFIRVIAALLTLPNVWIFTGSTDKSVRVWDVSSGKCIRILLGTKAAPRSLSFSPDGTTLAATAEDGRLLLWDLASARAHHGRTPFARSSRGPPGSCGSARHPVC